MPLEKQNQGCPGRPRWRGMGSTFSGKMEQNNRVFGVMVLSPLLNIFSISNKPICEFPQRFFFIFYFGSD